MRGNPVYQFEYDPEKKIVYKRHFGSISKEDIFNSWDHAIAQKLIPLETSGFIVDFRNAHLGIKMMDVKAIPHYFDLHSDIFGGKKMAVIVNTPEEIVFPVVIEHAKKSYFLKPFSTEEAALKWILE